MAFLRLLLYGGLIFISSTALSDDKNTEDNADTSIKYNSDYVIPMHYDVKLIPYFKGDEERDDTYMMLKTDIEEHQANGKFVFYGEINASIHISRPTTKLSLSSSNLIRYLSRELFEKSSNLTLERYYTYLVKKIEYVKIDNVKQTYVLHFKDELSNGNYTLNIKFLNAINIPEDDNIFLKNTYIKTRYIKEFKHEISQSVAGTLGATMYIWQNATYFLMKTIEAQRLFPCWDKPTIKTTFKISIKHHCKYSFFSNMPMLQKEVYKYVQSDDSEGCMQWTHFDITPSMPIHLVTIMISTMQYFPSHSADKIHMWRNPNSDDVQFAERVSNKVIMKLKFEWFRKMEIPKLQLVAIPGFRNDININFGLVAIRETDIIYNENLHPVARKIKIAQLIARGIAYQWFGNLINQSFKSSLWLNDGLTTLFGIGVVNAVNALEHYKKSEIFDLFIVQTQYESLQLDDCNLTRSLLSETSSPPEIDSLASYSRYVKAPLILYMLQYLITKEVFWKGISRYLNIHASEWTSPDDFWVTMQVAIYEIIPPYEEDIPAISDIIDDWIKYVNYPILKIMRNYNEKRMHIAMYIENKVSSKNSNQQRIPVTFTTQSKLNFTNFDSPFHDERLIFITSSLDVEVDIVEDGWVIFNLQQAGYYRVNYDSENWQRIAKYLNSREYTKIHVLNRAKIIDDAFYFMITQQLESSIFWNLTSYLAQETNYIAWYPMIKSLEHMSRIFPFRDRKVHNIKKKLNHILMNLISKIRYKESSEEDELTKCLRQEAIKWACILGNTFCQSRAYGKLLQYIGILKIKKDYRLLPWWEEWMYCKGLMMADFNTWHTIKNMILKQKHNNRYLEFLACSKNHINEYLKLITPQDNGTYIGIQANSCTNSFIFIIAKHAKNDTVLRNILTNFEKLKPRDISDLTALTIIINHVYSKKQLDEIRNATIDIIENNAFTRATEIFSKENSSHEATTKKSLKAYKNFRRHWTWCVRRKLEIRLSEIKKHVRYSRIFKIGGS